MSFAASHAMAHLAALQKEREEGDGDYTLTCQGKVIKAHAFILAMRYQFFYSHEECEHDTDNLLFQFRVFQEGSHH